MTSLRMILMTSLAGAALFVGGANSAPPPAGEIEPDAVQAVKRMAVYLSGLQTFEVKSDTVDEVVLETGQKLQFTRQVTYRVRRPNGFSIHTVSDRKARDFLYDGRQFAVVSPRTGLFASVDAPPTIGAVLDQVWSRYGISLPLEDLFRWGEVGDESVKRIKAAYHVGYARIAGQDADQYAYRGPDEDWQLWIKQGPDPVPLKVVITDRLDEAHPQYAAVLTWNLKPAVTADEFTFHPTASSHRIRLASQ